MWEQRRELCLCVVWLLFFGLGQLELLGVQKLGLFCTFRAILGSTSPSQVADPQKSVLAVFAEGRQGSALHGDTWSFKQEKSRRYLPRLIPLALQAVARGLCDSKLLKTLFLHTNSLSDTGVEVREACFRLHQC